MILSVSELNNQAKALLEANFSQIEVKGEISRLTKHSSGHWYFSLKDADAAISCVMFKMNNVKLKFEPIDAMEVVVVGKVTLYPQSGSYQINVHQMRLSGEGALELAFKALCEKLRNEGLFEVSFKKPLPKFPSKIALVTSKTSAALQDMLKIAKNRFNALKIVIFDTLTQGENAPQSLIAALTKADLMGFDTIILARGGGSREDLWCFNDENLARVIFSLQTPIISAIGHEIDRSISDFVSDHTSPTPSAAMNDLLPDSADLLQFLDTKSDELENLMHGKIDKIEYLLKIAENSLKSAVLNQKIAIFFSQIEQKELILKKIINDKFTHLTNKISLFENILNERSNFFKKSKNLVEIRKNGAKISLENVSKNDIIEIYSQNSHKSAEILS